MGCDAIKTTFSLIAGKIPSFTKSDDRIDQSFHRNHPGIRPARFDELNVDDGKTTFHSESLTPRKKMLTKWNVATTPIQIRDAISETMHRVAPVAHLHDWNSIRSNAGRCLAQRRRVAAHRGPSHPWQCPKNALKNITRTKKPP